MALGITRPRFAGDGPRLFSVRPHPFTPASPAWVAERGLLIYEAQADVVGGFPGFADVGAALIGARVRFTDAHLIVDEGSPHGFGLPTRWIEGYSLIPRTDSDEPALVVGYHDGSVERTFGLRFRAGRAGSRGGRRANRARTALHAAGIPELPVPATPTPPFAVPWERVSAFDSEQVVWHGPVSAPLVVGAAKTPSDAWLTTKSLIWGSGAGQGINRIPLGRVIELVTTRLRDRLGTPVIYLGVDGDELGRIEVPIVFNRESPPDRNFRERAVVLDALRALGIPDGETAPCWQPWLGDPLHGANADDAEEETTSDAEERAAAAVASPPPPEAEATPPEYLLWPTDMRSGVRPPQSAASDATHAGMSDAPVIDESTPAIDERKSARGALDRELPVATLDAAPAAGEKPNDSTERVPVLADSAAAASAEDVVLAMWTAPSQPELAADVPVAQHWAVRPEPARAHAEPDPDKSPDPLGACPGFDPDDPWATVRTYEANALAALDELFRAIDRRAAGRNPIPLTETPPSSLDQARALAELAELERRGLVGDADAGKRRERLLALGDVSVRLRTLVELHAAGYLSDAELGQKRKRLIDGLSISLVRM